MPARDTVLFDTQYAPLADTEMYVSPEEGGGTRIDKYSATNVDSVTRTITVRIVPPEGTPTGVDFVIVLARQVLAGASYLFPELAGQLIAPGGSVRMEASAANAFVTRASGRELTES